MRLYPTPNNMKLTEKEYFFKKENVLKISQKYLTKDREKIFKEIFKNFTSTCGNLKIEYINEENVAYFNNETQLIDRKNEYYSINIEDKGASISFKDEKCFGYAFFTLLGLIENRCTIKGNDLFTLPIGKIVDSPKIENRFVHLNFFPESDYKMMIKFIRLAGFLKYSHLILDFWGTYPYKEAKFLTWKKHHLTKKQIEEIKKEASAFNLEIIPAINIIGHAASSRACYGRNVALNQYPKLAPLFDESGWVWNIKNEEVLKIQKSRIREFCQMFPDGKLFMIGCDEPDGFGDSRLFNDVDSWSELTIYINELSKYVESTGRRAMMYADMLLYPCEEFKGCNTKGKEKEFSEKMLSNLNKNIILCDWQYNVETSDVKTMDYLRNNGFDVVSCGFANTKTNQNLTRNVQEKGIYGYMATTWNYLFSDGFLLPIGSICSWNDYVTADHQIHDFNIGEESILVVTTSYLRKLKIYKNDYKRAGIQKFEIN